MTFNRSLVPWLTVFVLAAGSTATLLAQPRVASTKGSGWQVSSSSDGYVVRVSPRVMKHFPKGARIQVTLDDPAGGKTVFTGMAAKLSGNSFKVKTGKRVLFRAAPGTWLLIRTIRQPGWIDPDDDTNCGGCSRDGSLHPDPDSSSCWCYSKAVALASSKPIGKVESSGMSACGGNSETLGQGTTLALQAPSQ